MLKFKFKLIAGLMVIMLLGFAGALVYEYSGFLLGGGSFEQTFFNDSGFVQLDTLGGSYVRNGTYTSSVMDFGNVETSYARISWKGSRSCPENMSYIDKLGGYCIDQYEAYNLGDNIPRSAPGQTPWVSISQTNAKARCVAAGKHLCSSAEWLGAANMQGKVYNLPANLATPPYNCNTGTSAAWPTGSSEGCVSAEGVYDMVGNVNEWTSEVVDTVKPCNTVVPGNCYPNSTGGWQATATSPATDIYGGDGVLFAMKNSAGRAVQRGGYWLVGSNAGLFSARLYYDATYTDPDTGFRCCREPD